MSRLTGGFLAIAAVLLALLGSFTLGSVTVPLGDIVGFLSGHGGPSEAILTSRADRTVIAVAAGAALALSGAVLQGVTRNPLADPGLLGINSGAALAIAVGYLAGIGRDQVSIVVLALVGALTATGVVLILNRLTGNSPVTVLLLGAAVTAGCSSVVSGISIYHQQALELLRFWQVGSVGGRDLALLLPSVPLLVAGAGLTLWSGPTLNTFAVGDDLASALGTRVRRMRFLLTLGAVLLAAGAVAIAGPLAFLGLLVPHSVRLLLGPDNRAVLAGSILLGPTLLLVADTTGRIIVPPAEVSAGLVVMLVGAPVLVILVRKAVRV